MRPWCYFCLLALAAGTVVSQVAFIYPPPFDATTDFSSNVIMVDGEFKVIQWANVENPNNARISVTMFQLNGTQFFGGPEYITQNAAPNTLSTPWTVNTNKNLTLSSMFYLNLFLEGETTSLTNSHYFNITRKSTTTSSSETSSSTSISQTSTSIVSLSAATPATTPPVATQSSGLSSGAIAGIVVAVMAAAILGAAVGWCVFGRGRKMADVFVHPPIPFNYYDSTKRTPNDSHEMSAEPMPPVRYELPPDRQ